MKPMSLFRDSSIRWALALIALSLPTSLSHGDGHGGAMSEADLPKDDSEYPPTYFSLSDHSGLMYAHICLMTLSWVFVLPVGT